MGAPSCTYGALIDAACSLLYISEFHQAVYDFLKYDASLVMENEIIVQETASPGVFLI